MEPQEKIYCYDNHEKEEKCTKKRNCLGIVAIILLAAFVFVIGLIIGAALYSTILSALSAIIVLAIVLGLLLLITIIFMICNNKKDRKHKEKCCF